MSKWVATLPILLQIVQTSITPVRTAHRDQSLRACGSLDSAVIPLLQVGPEDGGFHPPQREIPNIDHVNFPRLQYMFLKAGFEPWVTWGEVRSGRRSLELYNAGLVDAKAQLRFAELPPGAQVLVGEKVTGAATGAGWVAEVRRQRAGGVRGPCPPPLRAARGG